MAVPVIVRAATAVERALPAQNVAAKAIAGQAIGLAPVTIASVAEPYAVRCVTQAVTVVAPAIADSAIPRENAALRLIAVWGMLGSVQMQGANVVLRVSCAATSASSENAATTQIVPLATDASHGSAPTFLDF
jgi:hypothetical protein